MSGDDRFELLMEGAWVTYLGTPYRVVALGQSEATLRCKCGNQHKIKAHSKEMREIEFSHVGESRRKASGEEMFELLKDRVGKLTGICLEQDEEELHTEGIVHMGIAQQQERIYVSDIDTDLIIVIQWDRLQSVTFDGVEYHL